MKRPPVAELVARVYSRAIHPELWELLALRRVERPGFALTVRVIAGGHVVELRTVLGVVTECLAAPGLGLPAGVAIERSLSSAQRGKAEFAAARYEISSRAELLDPEPFAYAHAELIRDGARRGFLTHFPTHNRLGLAPVSYLTADPVPGGLAVAGFHTFPDEFAVVKTQSLWEFGLGDPTT